MAGEWNRGTSRTGIPLDIFPPLDSVDRKRSGLARLWLLHTSVKIPFL